MSTLELLNNVDHKGLKIITKRAARYGDDYMCVPTFPKEFRAVQAYYPIVFSKNSENESFTPLVLFGLQENENLFVQDNQWDAPYIPACAECKPFYIGRSSRSEEELVIHVDRESPKLSEHEGENLFLEYGGNSDYLGRISEVLGAVHEGVNEVPSFINILLEYRLLEPFTVETRLISNELYKLEGFYTVNEEKLSGLGNAEIYRLHQSGYLADIYMQLASLSQIKYLIARKNARVRAVVN